MTVRDWPDMLRAAGVTVKVHPEVLTLSHGDLRDTNIVWHHDASPPGDSPGALDWMKSHWDIASAQIWVDRAGTWHFISYGVAWHAGAVNNAAFDNWHAVGIETDHTTGEDWPAAQLQSLRRGTAVCLAHEGKTAANLAFHKTICVPVGRKSDPDGLDLRAERTAVGALIGAPVSTHKAEPPSPPSEDEEDSMISIIVPTDIPKDAQAYPVAHDGNRIWGISSIGVWTGAGAKQMNVPYADWKSFVDAYGGADAVDIVGDNAGEK